MSDAPFDLVDAKDCFTDTDWFHSCRTSQMPYIVIRSGESSADVLWDYVTLPPCCDFEIQANFAALERDARAIFERFATPESYLRVKPTMICFDHLPLDQAKRAAVELYRLIAGYMPAPRPTLRYPAGVSKVHDINRDPQRTSPSRRLWVEDNDPSSSVA